MPFDSDFESTFSAFWSWKGEIQDGRAALRMILLRPGENIGTVFAAWRDVCDKKHQQIRLESPIGAFWRFRYE